MPTFSIKNHRLYRDGKPVDYYPSPNVGRPITPRIVVIHYTGDNGFKGAISWLTASVSGVSAHLVIAKNGEVVQLVPFNVAAWHAGASEYNGEQGVNSFSIGIENVGVGDEWPDAQVEVIRDVLSALSHAYDIEDIVGHEDVAPGRKVDPGPNFPWDKVTAGEAELAPKPELPPVEFMPKPPEVELPPVPEPANPTFWEWLWKRLAG